MLRLPAKLVEVTVKCGSRSSEIAAQPEIIDPVPTRANWWTAEFPPVITPSSISACPPSRLPLAKVQPFPTSTSCPACDPAMK